MVQYSAFGLLLHYSRVMPPTGGKRYLTSTAVFLNEVIKLTISLTMALYEVSKNAPPSMPATSLFFSLISAVFSGDSWKLAIPALLYTLSNSLQYVALSNMQAATFQVTHQLKVLVSALFALGLLRRNIPVRKWAALLLLLVGVVFVQMPDGTSDESSSQDAPMHPYFPRSLEEWRSAQARSGFRKRSATYEGIHDDINTAFPRLDSETGLLATGGACLVAGLAGVYFEKVLKDSASSASLWIRNVQLAIYSIFPALFIGVVFLDGEQVASDGFFVGYNLVVWSTIMVQAVGGIVTGFSIAFAHKVAKNLAIIGSIVLSTLASIWLFEFQVSVNFILGTLIVIAAIYIYGNPCVGSTSSKLRPPPINVGNYGKHAQEPENSSIASPTNDFSIKLPSVTFLSDTTGLSSSRPTSPGQVRSSSGRVSSGSYFPKDS